MAVWLIPVCLFATLSALYLGGAPIRMENGGRRELVGLLLSLVLYLVAWAALRTVLRGPLGGTPALIAASVLTVIALPLLCLAGFRIVGVRIRRRPRGEEHVHA